MSGVLVGFVVGLGLALVVAALAYWKVRGARANLADATARAERAERLVAGSDPVFVVGRDGRVRDANPTAAELLAGAGLANGAPLTELFHLDDREKVADVLLPASGPSGGTIVARMRPRSLDEAGPAWEIARGTIDGGDEATGEVVVRLREVDEREALRKELAARRLHDPLTGLPTRALFLDRLAHALALAARRAEILGVFLVDTGDVEVPGVATLPGTAARERLVQDIADRIQLALRHGDSVARLDDGRFVVLLESLHDVLDAAAVAERILERFLLPIPVGGAEALVVPRIGVALDGGHESPEILMLQAEAAVVAARRSSQAPYAVFDPSMATTALDQAGLEAELRRALATNELRLRFQPIVRLDGGEVVAYEATPVWQHPRSGLVPSADLHALADAAGLNVPLGFWTLVSACRQIREWQRTRPDGAPLICLDVTPQQFRSPGLAGDVARVVHEAGLNPQQLRLEISQSLALEDIGATVTRLLALKEVGIQVAIDGFGTGYAALGFLQRCPVDALKIGGAYVAGLGVNPDDSAIVRAALAFARGLQIPVVADGVETAAQRDELLRLGCELGQGALFAAVATLPEPPTDVPGASASPNRSAPAEPGRGGEATAGTGRELAGADGAG